MIDVDLNRDGSGSNGACRGGGRVHKRSGGRGGFDMVDVGYCGGRFGVVVNVGYCRGGFGVVNVGYGGGGFGVVNVGYGWGGFGVVNVGYSRSGMDMSNCGSRCWSGMDVGHSRS
jgi:hypothetical protein